MSDGGAADKNLPELAGPFAIRDVAARLVGARLCYGEPVVQGKRTVIPVASVRVAGGGGFGRGGGGGEEDRGEGGGGGGGGSLNATPVGFIEVGPEGSRYHRIVEPEGIIRALAAAAVALGGLAAVRRRRLSR